MSLTPEQIVAEDFRIRARGYDRDEVDAFLDRLADQVEADAARRKELEQRLAALEAELTASRDRETTLTRTLVTVQDAADRAHADAHAEVAALRTATERELLTTRERAAAEAAQVRADAEREAEELRSRLREIQGLDAAHRDQLRAHLEEQRRALDEIPDPYASLLERVERAAPGPDRERSASEPVTAPEPPDPTTSGPSPLPVSEVGPPTSEPGSGSAAGEGPDEEPEDGLGGRPIAVQVDDDLDDRWRRRDDRDEGAAPHEADGSDGSEQAGDDGDPQDEERRERDDRPVEPDPPIWG